MTERLVRARARKIDKDTDVEVTSNVKSSFSYLDKRGTAIELNSHGDTEYLTFGELKTMASGKNKKVLQNMYIIITDIDDPDFTVDDVVKQLRLERYYDAAKKILNVDEIDSYSFDDFVKEASKEEIEGAVKNENMITCLTESALELYRNGDIDIDKTRVIFESFGIKDFYDFLSDISPE